MDIEAKQTIQCDSCKATIRLPKKKKSKAEETMDEPEGLEATLHNGLGDTKDYHFCDEECLRVFLNERRKKAKASLELDFVSKESRIRLDE